MRVLDILHQEYNAINTGGCFIDTLSQNRINDPVLLSQDLLLTQSVLLSTRPSKIILCCTMTTSATPVINPRNRARLIRLSRKPSRKIPSKRVNRPTNKVIRLAQASGSIGSPFECKCCCIAIDEPTNKASGASGPTDICLSNGSIYHLLLIITVWTLPWHAKDCISHSRKSDTHKTMNSFKLT